MKKTAEAKVAPVRFTPKELEVAAYGLKIWRQVLVGQAFVEFQEQAPGVCQDTLVDVDSALEKLEKAREK